MFRREIAPLGELEDASSPHVRVPVGLRDLLPVARDEVEHQSFAQRKIAQRDVLCSKPAQDLVDEDRAGNCEVGASGFETGNTQALLESQRCEFFSQPSNLLGREPAVSERDALTTAIGRHGHGTQAEYGARSPDHAIEPGSNNLIQMTADFSIDMSNELALVSSIERIGFDESLRQPDDAKLEAAADVHGRAGASRHFDAAAADIDHHCGVTGHADAIHCGLMDQAGFFGARDDTRPYARLLRNGTEKLAAVFGFARGAGGNCNNLINLMRFGKPPELR